MSVYKLHAKKVNGTPSKPKTGLVYIYLYKLETRHKEPVISILKNPITNKGIKIPEGFCRPSVTEFRKVSNQLPKHYLNGFNSVDELNTYFEEQLTKFISLHGDKRFVGNDSKYLNDYVERIITRQSNQGTKLTYLNLKSILIQFNMFESEGKKYDALLKNLDTDYLLRFHKYLMSAPIEEENKYIQNYKTKNPYEKIRQRKKNTRNTANDKLKRLKAVLNAAHDEGWYRFLINPFDAYSNKFDDVKIDILSVDELKSLINTKYVEVLRRTAPDKNGKTKWGHTIPEGVEERNKKNKRYVSKHTLFDIRNYWLFQLFSQGIRVSDLITLRWWDFTHTEGLRIEKKMVKTRNNIKILVNDKMTDILLKHLSRYSDIFTGELSEIDLLNENITELLRKCGNDYRAIIPVDYKHSKICEILLDHDHIKLEGGGTNMIPQYSIDEKGLELLTERIPSYKKEKYNSKNKPSPIMHLPPRIYDKDISELENWFKKEKEKYVKNQLPKLKKLKSEKHNLLCSVIGILSAHRNTKKDFVFTLLNDADFSNIGRKDSFDTLSEEQYRKFQSVRTYYNKLLKIIQVQAEIKPNLTTHLARHSYTSLMLELGENINLFDVMTSLGHKHLATTQGYIRRFTNEKIDKLNQVISDKLDTEFISI